MRLKHKTCGLKFAVDQIYPAFFFLFFPPQDQLFHGRSPIFTEANGEKQIPLSPLGRMQH